MTPLNDNPQSRSQTLQPFVIVLAVVLGTIAIAAGGWTSFTYFVPLSPASPKLVGAAVVTVPVLCCALYVIVSPKYGDADKKWAYGAIGTLLGFWLGAT